MGTAHRFCPEFEATYPGETLILDPEGDENHLEIEVIFEGALDETIMLAWPGRPQFMWLLDWLAADCRREHEINVATYPESEEETRALGWSVKVYWADYAEGFEQVPLYQRTS